MLYNALQLPRTPKVPIPMGSSYTLVLHVSRTQPTQHPKLHLDLFSQFCTAHASESLYTLQRNVR